MRIFKSFIFLVVMLMMLTSIMAEECEINNEERSLCKSKYCGTHNCFTTPCPQPVCSRPEMKECIKCMCEHHDISKC
ncbi:hypothetical protein Anas_04328 [Armadillidium nasatum]|uniref:Uncharacterized protein n=1 Tax=Armadillidium nasatum TaxID=96803 RepID=A0A5N5SW80_9CRUS|nr:hypothetical protein Anas_04328 [Armadillidium nasatum]